MKNSTHPSPEVVPALALWVQLATRITTLPLHYRSGHEESAAVSVFDIFPVVRKLVTDHPDAGEFRSVAVNLLNQTLRSYTDRWHGWMMKVEDAQELDGRPTLRFADEQVRHIFRQELIEVREKLIEVKKALAILADIEDTPDTVVRQACLGDSLVMEIQGRVPIGSEPLQGGKLASLDDINRAEREAIAGRRALFSNPEGESDTSDEGARPEGRVRDAIGLALSGGGIRSATFCLGIVQVLARKKLLPQFDLLSTVSGGGYFGGFLSSALGSLRRDAEGAYIEKKARTREEAEKRIESVFGGKSAAGEAAKVETDLLRHLRNNSNYLLGGGLWAKAKITGLLLSGILFNVLMALPFSLGGALLLYALGPVLWGTGQVDAFPDLTGTVSGYALLISGVALAVFLLALPIVQKGNHGKPPGESRIRAFWETGALWVGLITLFFGFVYLLPALFIGYDCLRTLLIDWGPDGTAGKTISSWAPTLMTGAASAVLGILAKFLGPQWPRIRAVAIRLFILSGPLFFLFVFFLVGNHLGIGRDGDAIWHWGWVLGVTVFLGLWSWLGVDINALAPHVYYRNRTCECYLARSASEAESETGVDVLTHLPLSDLGADATAPYHLVNMTVNLGSSKIANLRGRGSDFFMASQGYCGSPTTGYVETETLEKADPHFDLGTAMAVSGAAASSNMGFKTIPHLRFLMTLLNVRLGYWLKNPRRKLEKKTFSSPGPWNLLREMFGKMDEDGHYVNLSDGGHIENLGVYELLRRRCKFIVSVDAGMEPGMECADLVRLQRYAEIDLGLRMHFDPTDLQVEPNGYSLAYALLVKIDYAPGADGETNGRELGWMLYLKLAMTGEESTFVKDYKRVNPGFPHESTADQLYEEEQFEAYRALGESAMSSLFREELLGTANPSDVRDWFQKLVNNLLPDNDEAFGENG